jgi:Protein of unknown function (DUF3072)
MEEERKEARPGELEETPSADVPQDPGVQKDPSEWLTGDEPMTPAQASYLRTLSERTNEPFDEDLTKAQASKRIDELRAKGKPN